jgi:hypothetical protein
MRKILVIVSVLFACVVGYSDDTLWRYVSAADEETYYSVFDNLFRTPLNQEKKPSEDAKKEEPKAVEQTPKPAVSQTPPVAKKQQTPLRMRLFAVKLGAFVPTAARMGLPNEGFCVGLVARLPLNPLKPEWGKLEFGCTSTAGTLEIRPSQNGIVYSSIEQSYWDVTLCYLRRIFLPTQEPHIYAGIGLGLGQEIIRYERTGTSWSDSNNTGVFIFKLGWDTLSNFFIELSYRRLIDSDSNAKDILELSFAIYF